MLEVVVAPKFVYRYQLTKCHSCTSSVGIEERRSLWQAKALRRRGELRLSGLLVSKRELGIQAMFMRFESMAQLARLSQDASTYLQTCDSLQTCG
jgi:hypothetical protein